MPEGLNWDDLRELARRVSESGQPLVLTDETRAILRRCAPQVAIALETAEQALSSEAEATALLEQIARRIREGSHRLSRTLSQSYRLQQMGDLEGARQLMLDLLAVEVVPHYREIAQSQLKALEDP